jgi:hypothetical protein
LGEDTSKLYLQRNCQVARSSFVDDVWGGEDVLVANSNDTAGGQSLVFWSRIKDRHSCPRIEKIHVAYNFDSAGAFRGRTLEELMSDLVEIAGGARSEG